MIAADILIMMGLILLVVFGLINWLLFSKPIDWEKDDD